MRTGLPMRMSARSGASMPPRAAVAALAVAAALLGACNTGNTITGSLPDDGYKHRYPIVLAEAPENLDIPVGMGSAGLSDAQRDTVRAFAASAADKGTGSLVILTPSGSANEATAGAVARQVRQVALGGGIASGLVETRTYAVGDANAAAPIRLTYSRIKAVTPPCGRWTSSILPDNDVDGANFGCANQANLAAMIAEPQDLIAARAQTPIPAWRRWFVLDRYGKGESTAGSYQTGNTSAGSGGSGG